MDVGSSSYDHFVARWLGHAVARSLGRLVARSLGRLVARSLGRSVAQTNFRDDFYTKPIQNNPIKKLETFKKLGKSEIEFK